MAGDSTSGGWLVGGPLVGGPVVGGPLVGGPVVGGPLVGGPLVGGPLVGVVGVPDDRRVEMLGDGPSGETFEGAGGCGAGAGSSEARPAVRNHLSNRPASSRACAMAEARIFGAVSVHKITG